MSARVSAWLLLAAGDSRQHGGNEGYDDQADVYYTWDSTVPNHARIKAGDPIAIWDKDRLLGVSVIEEITTRDTEKLIFKCRRCGTSKIKARSTLSPRYRCQECGEVFEKPESQAVNVTEYRSRHDAAWSSLENLLSGPELRGLCTSPKSQLSMRSLRWSDFQQAVSQRGAAHALERVVHRSPDFLFPHGHILQTVRVRRGQRQFREHLLASYGEQCAFTGMAPARALEAGHLYSYAELGVHYEHGGLLLRRDVHRLFDDGWLAVDPDGLKIHVSDNLLRFPQYGSLDGHSLKVRVRASQVDWLARHWHEHRAG